MDMLLWTEDLLLGHDYAEGKMKIALAILAISFAPFVVLAQTADDIVEKSIAARGGIARLKAIQSERVTGRIISKGGEVGRFLVELKRPRKMRMEMTRSGKTVTRIYDGQSGGWVVDSTVGKAEPVPMTVNEIKNIQKEADFDGPLLEYKKKENQVELIGKEKINRKTVYKLRVQVKGEDVRYYYFDAASFLLIKWEGSRIDDGKEVVVESFFHEYRDVYGVKFAFEIETRVANGGPGQKIDLERVEINAPLDDSRFSKPEIAATTRSSLRPILKQAQHSDEVNAWRFAPVPYAWVKILRERSWPTRILSRATAVANRWKSRELAELSLRQ